MIYGELAEIADEEFFDVVLHSQIGLGSFVCTSLMEVIWASGFLGRSREGLLITGKGE